MASVGVRELRQRASELLRRVEPGETIEGTDRGRPVAVLAPLPSVGALERLRSGGCVQMTGERATYLDSSALVKLAVEEPESVALRRYLRARNPFVVSALAR